jgi:hypothetical protein
MIDSRCPALLFILVFLASLVGCASYGTSVHTHNLQGDYALHVPVFSVQVVIPKNGFVQKDPRQVGGSDSPRYFWFQDDDRGIIISGWFESDTVFPGIREFWEKDTKHWVEKGLPAPVDIAFEKIGYWDAIIYDIQNPELTNSHIRAHWLQTGTWIDIHLSISTKAPTAEARSTLKDLLSAVRVEKVKYYAR